MTDEFQYTEDYKSYFINNLFLKNHCSGVTSGETTTTYGEHPKTEIEWMDTERLNVGNKEVNFIQTQTVSKVNLDLSEGGGYFIKI